MPLLEHTHLVHEPQRAEPNDAMATVTEPPVMQQEVLLPVVLVPGEMWLGTVFDSRLRVLSPIRVRLFSEHDSVVAEATDLDEFGYGSNISEAVRDIQRAVVQLYFSLEESSDRLGADLASTWAVLQRLVVKIQQPT